LRQFGTFSFKFACFTNGFVGKNPIKIYYKEFDEAMRDADEYMQKSGYDWMQVWDMRQIKGTMVNRWIRQDGLEYIEVEI